MYPVMTSTTNHAHKTALTNLDWIEQLHTDWRRGSSVADQDLDTLFGLAYDGVVSNLYLHKLPMAVALPDSVSDCHLQIKRLRMLIESIVARNALVKHLDQDCAQTVAELDAARQLIEQLTNMIEPSTNDNTT